MTNGTVVVAGDDIIVLGETGKDQIFEHAEVTTNAAAEFVYTNTPTMSVLEPHRVSREAAKYWFYRALGDDGLPVKAPMQPNM